MKALNIAVTLIIVVALVGAGYWITVNSESGPAVSIPQESYDFGPVRYGDIPTHEFSVINSGDAELVIEKISTSCGCTTAEISNEIIEPGGEATLTVYFNPAVHGDDTDLGELTRVVYLATNDPINPESELTISASVYKE